MPDFLKGLVANSATVPVELVLVRLMAALVLGFAVTFIYRKTRAPQDVALSFQTTLVLLSVLIAMVTQVIGDSVARAFSLVGALSIVRFRTVVRDTQDTAYVIFAVVIGMAMGASDFSVALVGIGVVGCAAVLTKPRATPPDVGVTADPPEFLLTLRVDLGVDLEAMTPVFDSQLKSWQLNSFATARQGTALEAVYGVQMRAGGSPGELVRALNRIEGVQNVQIERADTAEGPQG